MLQSFDDYGELAESNHEREMILEARALFEGMKSIVFVSTFENLPTNWTHKWMSLCSKFDRFFSEFFFLAWSEDDWEANKDARVEELVLLLEFNKFHYIQEMF